MGRAVWVGHADRNDTVNEMVSLIHITRKNTKKR
jgi:hypothetical protein